MAKGDKQRHQNQLDFQTKNSQNQTNNMMNGMIIPATQNSYNQFNSSLGSAQNDYADIMSQYRNFNPSPFVPINFTPVTAELASYNRTPEFNEGMGYYRDFANTGGFKPEDLSNIRARSVSPIRAIYGNAKNDIERQRNLAGGYSPNYNAVTSKMARESSGMLADKMSEVEGMIAQMVQEGKKFGTSGFGNMATTDLNLATQVALANAAATNNANLFNADGSLKTQMFNSDERLKNDASRLAAINGQVSLYGTQPGIAGMLGNQFQSNIGNWLQGQNMLNQIGQNAIQGQYVNSQIPSNFSQAMNNIGQGFNLAGQIGSAISPFLPLGSSLPSSQIGMSPYFKGPQTYMDPTGMRRY